MTLTSTKAVMEPRTKSEKGYVILGGAFDDSIDELKAAGFEVEILAEPQGVIR